MGMGPRALLCQAIAGHWLWASLAFRKGFIHSFSVLGHFDFVFCFETGSLCIDQVVLELTEIFLPLPQEFSDQKGGHPDWLIHCFIVVLFYGRVSPSPG